MLHKIFTVFDSKTEAFLQPFFMPAKGAAIRAFTDLANDKNHNFGKYPEDFILFERGSYDDSTAKFELNKAPVSLGIAIEFIKANN